MSMEIEGNSLDVKAEKLEMLKAILPELFTEGKIDFARVKELFGDDLAEGDHYELSWAGKAEARKEIQKQTSATLIPDREGSVNFDSSENILIEGENLEVLRILQKSYFGRVKMIYIDPPYNTGSDSFIYPDDYAERKVEYERRTGTRNGAGYLNKLDLFKKNVKESGQYHSVWLSMMYPRLYLARNLLSEDGVIFVSIDDNESANLRLVMNEIFGAENFIADIIWHSKYTVANDARYVSYQHEHLLFYAKNKDVFQIGLLDRTAEMDSAYSNPDNDNRGVWKATPLHAKSGNNVYVFTFPNGITWTPPKGTYPRYSQQTLQKMYEENRVYFGKDGKSAPAGKTFLSEVKKGKTVGSIWNFKEVGSSHQANEELSELLGKGMFDNPKPTSLIKTCLKVANTDEHSLILDFFAGSGTVAQAVIQLNREDGGNRKFILVQMPESCEESSEAYQSGHKTIADICKARLQKAIENVENSNNNKMKFARSSQDLGFKSYSLSYSNFMKWQAEITGKEDLLAQLALFKEPLLGKPTDSYVLLVELLLKAGLPLSANVEKRESKDGVRYYVVERDRIAFALDAVSDTLLAEVEELKPKVFVALGNLFSGEKADELMTNWKLQLKETGIDLKVI